MPYSHRDCYWPILDPAGPCIPGGPTPSPAAPRPCSVYLHVASISSVGLAQCPHLYAPLDRFCGQVLAEAQATLEFYHRFVYGSMSVRGIDFLEASCQVVDIPPQLPHLVSSGSRPSVVLQVQVAPHQVKLESSSCTASLLSSSNGVATSVYPRRTTAQHIFTINKTATGYRKCIVGRPKNG